MSGDVDNAASDSEPVGLTVEEFYRIFGFMVLGEKHWEDEVEILKDTER